MKLKRLFAADYLLLSGALVFSPTTPRSCFTAPSTNTWECLGENGARHLLPLFMRHTAAVCVN